MVEISDRIQDRITNLKSDLEVMQREYQERVKPYIDLIVSYSNLEKPKPVITDKGTYVYTGPWPPGNIDISSIVSELDIKYNKLINGGLRRLK
jgi:hypothetical protein